ncbi:MAG TPA: hypothetical protein DEQ38_02490 [Elusimicrobia bacterium]|nr:MAG: hypothetical protein A2089_10710 [Elusimicrobia bacterium GWD2_63_28]HCC46978.1 hypothetical protein [Elusimicrobiota bacterium]
MTNKTPFRAEPRSWTLAHFLPGDFKGFKTENLLPADFPAGAYRVKNSMRRAVLASPELKAPFAFDQLLLSAGVSGAPFSAEARVQTAAGWSPWFSCGRFEPRKSASAPAAENAFGKMDTDILKLSAKATALRYRLTLFPAPGKKPLIKIAAACGTDSTLPYRHAPGRPAGAALKLALPRFSQMAQKVGYAGDICSPTSLAMVLSGLGVKAGAIDTAAAVRDYGAGIYGNWFFNTAYAGARGFYTLLTRLNSLEQARGLLEAGVPVIASLTFGPGELANSPLNKTRGHLLVITGFTAGGDVITHDPAAPRPGSVERVYDRAQFSRAWLGNKYGLAYIAAKNFGSLLAVKSKVTELYDRPPRGAKERLKFIESQLVQNERVELLEISGPWARVRALEQASLKSNGKTLSPYLGWLRAEHLGFSLPEAHTAVVKSKTAASAGGELSMGVKLAHAGRPHGRHLNPLPGKAPAASLRRQVLAAARLFLGDKYYWGGRSAWGVDCSGLVNLAFRAWGLDLPRNAGDQLAASRPVSRAELKPADLIFSAAAARPAAITHVMLYSGGGRLIEATGDTNSVREVSFAKKFGVSFSGAENGMTAGGKKIFFGRIID